MVVFDQHVDSQLEDCMEVVVFDQHVDSLEDCKEVVVFDREPG